MTLIDRNSRTSSSDFIYLILLRFFLLLPLLSSIRLAISLRIFPSPLFLAARDCLLWSTLSLSLSLPLSLSVSLICAHVTVRLRRWTRKDWSCTISQTCLTASRRLKRTVLYRRKGYHPCSEPSGELFFTYRFTSVHGPANGPSQTNHRPTNRCGFLIPRLYKCHPSVPTCNRVHHSWKLLSATNTTTLLVYLPTIALNPYVTKALIYMNNRRYSKRVC